MTESRAAAMVEKYQRLAWAEGRKFARRTGRCPTACAEAGQEILHNCLMEWDESAPEMKEANRIRKFIRWRLVDYFRTHEKSRARLEIHPMDFSEPEEEEDFSPELEQVITGRPSWSECLLRELGEEGQAVVRLILHGPAEILEDMMPTTHARAARTIRKHLADHGWEFEKINRAWREVQACL
jgi:hypothetical protein